MDGWMIQIDGWMDKQTDKHSWMDGYGWMDGWMDGWIDR